MIPILYDKNETAFESNGLGRLADADRCLITENRNGMYELEMTYPIDGIHFSDIALGMYIAVKPSRYGSVQPFEIYKISKPIDGMVTINAQHISYRLSKIPVMPFTAETIGSAMQGLVTYSAEANPFTFWTDKGTAATYSQSIPMSCRECIGGTEGSLLDIYGGELEWDKWTVKLWSQRGSDKGYMIRYGVNLVTLEQEESIENTITGICPFWRGSDDGVDVTITLPEKVVDSSYASAYPYKRTVVVDMTEQFQTQPTEEQLRGAAQSYIQRNRIGVPSVNLTLSFVNLPDTVDYKDSATMENISLCDTVSVEFEKLGVSAKAEVITTVWDALRDRYDSIEVGDAKTTLADTIVEIDDTASSITQNVTSTIVSQIAAATAAITGARNGYVRSIYDADGNWSEIVIMDTNDISTATNVWRWNSGGLGYSSTGYNGTYSTAITSSGQIVADFVSTGTMSADRIVSNGKALTAVIELVDETVSRVDSNEDAIGTMTKWFRFSSEGFSISEEGSALSTLFTNEDIEFLDNGVVVSYVSGQRMYIRVVEFIDKSLWRHGENGTVVVSASVNESGWWVLKGEDE